MYSHVRKLTLTLAVAFALAAAAQDDGRIEGYDKLHRDNESNQPVQLEADEQPRLETHPEVVRDDDDHDSDRRDDDARDLVETVMMVRMAEELQLDDEQTVMMVRRLRELKQEMMKMRHERWDRYKELKNALDNDENGEAIDSQLNELLDYDRKLETFKQDRLETLSEGLTTAQRAKLYVFLCEFENDMRHLVHRAQGRGWGKPGDNDRDEKDWRDKWKDRDQFDRDGEKNDASN